MQPMLPTQAKALSCAPGIHMLHMEGGSKPCDHMMMMMMMMMMISACATLLLCVLLNCTTQLHCTFMAVT